MKAITEVFDKEGIIAEHTPPYSPEFNGVVEQRLTILLRRALASTVNAGLNKEARQLLWAEAVSYNNFTENITISTRRDKPPATFCNSNETKWIPYLQPFGRIGVVTTKKSFKAKFKEKGTKMIIVGYAQNHPRGTYRLYNPAKQSVVTSRDIYWHDFTPYNPKADLNIFVVPTVPQSQNNNEQMKIENKMSESPRSIPVLDAGRQYDEKQFEKTSRNGNTEKEENNEENSKEENTNEKSNEENANEENNELTKKERRIARELLKLQCSYNPEASIKTHITNTPNKKEKE